MSFFENAQRWFENKINSQPIFSGMQNYAPTSNSVLAPLILLIIVPIVAIASLASWLFGTNRSNYPAPSYSRNNLGSICGDDNYYQPSYARMNSCGIRTTQSCCSNSGSSYVIQPTASRGGHYSYPSQSTQMSSDIYHSPTQSSSMGGGSYSTPTSSYSSGNNQSVSMR